MSTSLNKRRTSDAQKGTGRRVLLGMSGGVDSSVACFLLQERGYEVVGLTLITNPLSEAHLEDVRAISQQAGIKLIEADVRDLFQKQIIDDFIASYAHGRTPNPCVNCNPTIKFGTFIDMADAHGCDYVATGHYASVRQHPDTGRLSLTRTNSGLKDQTYFMYRLTQDQLARLLLPLENMQKEAVRRKAAELGLSGQTGQDLAKKPDSQDNCFVPESGYAAFIKDQLEANGPRDWLRLLEPGPVFNLQGNEIGTHQGLIHYTVGQRKGFQVQTTDRLFVLGKDSNRNALIVGHHDQLMRTTIQVVDLVYSGMENITPGMYLSAKIRNSAKPKRCRVYLADEKDNEPSADLVKNTPLIHAEATLQTTPDKIIKTRSLKVVFDEPVPAPAPGQSCVLYDDIYIMAGGYISDQYLQLPSN